MTSAREALNPGEGESEREERGCFLSFPLRVGPGVTAWYKPVGEKRSPQTSNVHMFLVGSP